jgi:cyclopropane-fatty-acyl-phospholipid synthase
MDSSLSRLQAPIFKSIHWLNRNTREGSRRNISAHYDLGNDMFRLFLDDNMMYSSAIYPDSHSSLEEAAEFKLERICQKLELTENDHVLEIGTGWGGFALYAAKNYGCRITTTTISKEQYELAKKRVESEGLQDKITLLLRDYRDLNGQFDKLVSIEMIEAIGHQYINTYFKKCSELLKPEGMMLIQAITIADQRYKAALKEVDFIKRYIFPGCFIPSNTAMQNAITESTDMRVQDLEDIGFHYARTLHDWQKRFFANIEKVKALGYPDEFIRLWEFYLCYCEGGFAERATSNVQLLLVKPENRVSC